MDLFSFHNGWPQIQIIAISDVGKTSTRQVQGRQRDDDDDDDDGMGDCEKKDWKGTAHALDPISRPEIVKAVAAVKKSRVDDAIRFNVVDVEEPPKLALIRGETTRRVVSVTFQVESKVSLLLLAVVLASDLALLLAQGLRCPCGRWVRHRSRDARA